MAKPVYTFKSSVLKAKYLNYRRIFIGVIIVGAISAFLTKQINDMKYLVLACIIGGIVALWQQNKVKKADEELKRIEAGRTYDTSKVNK